MQRVAELVEERADLVAAEQHRLPGRGLGDVQVVDDHRLAVEQLALLDEFVHPGPAALGRAGEEVGQEEAQWPAVLLEDLEDPGVGVVADQVRALGEAQPVGQARRVEHAVVQHPVELVVRAQHRAVQVVLGLADPLAVVGEVVRAEVGDAVGRRLLAQPGQLPLGVGHRGRHQPVQQRADGLDTAGRLVGHHVGGVARVAEERGPLRPQRGHPGGHRAVVGQAPVERGGQQLAAHRAVGQPGQGRLHGEVQQAEHVLAVVPARPAVLGGGGDLRLGQPGQLLSAVQHQGAGGVGGEQVPLEGGGSGGQLGVQLAQPLLVGRRQLRPGPHEAHVVALQQAQRLGVQVQRGALGVHGVEPREERAVQADGVGVRRQPRLELGLQLLQLRVGVRGALVVEHRQRPPQQHPGALQGDHRVLEARGLRIGGDPRDLGELLGHARFEGRPVVLGADLGVGGSW